MKKKRKIRLESIKVQSFVTSLGMDEKNKVNGGIPQDTDPIVTCPQSVIQGNSACEPTYTCQTECNCQTLGCPSYICEESVTCN